MLCAGWRTQLPPLPGTSGCRPPACVRQRGLSRPRLAPGPRQLAFAPLLVKPSRDCPNQCLGACPLFGLAQSTMPRRPIRPPGTVCHHRRSGLVPLALQFPSRTAYPRSISPHSYPHRTWEAGGLQASSGSGQRSHHAHRKSLYGLSGNMLKYVNGGEGGIRTHGELAPTTVFETVPIDHSGTSPRGASRAKPRSNAGI